MEKYQIQVPYRVSQKTLNKIKKGDYKELFESVLRFLHNGQYENYEISSFKGPYLLESETENESIYLINFQKKQFKTKPKKPAPF